MGTTTINLRLGLQSALAADNGATICRMPDGTLDAVTGYQLQVDCPPRSPLVLMRVRVDQVPHMLAAADAELIEGCLLGRRDWAR